MTKNIWMTNWRRIAIVGVSLATATAVLAVNSGAQATVADEVMADHSSLDGSGNNLDSPTLGQVGLVYPRVAEANYADDISEVVDGPDVRYISNRVFNDTAQNIFSEGGVSHWAFV